MTVGTDYRADTTNCRAEFARVQAGESDGAIVVGDCRAVLPALPDDSVDLVITSPPFNVAKPYDDFDDQLHARARAGAQPRAEAGRRLVRELQLQHGGRRDDDLPERGAEAAGRDDA